MKVQAPNRDIGADVVMGVQASLRGGVAALTCTCTLHTGDVKADGTMRGAVKVRDGSFL